MAETKYFFDGAAEAQQYAAKKDWDGFNNFFEEEGNIGKLLKPFDLFGNTAIHAVARSGNAKLLEELLNILMKQNEEGNNTPLHEAEFPDGLKDILKKKNKEGNTLLHEAVLHDDLQHDWQDDLETVDVIMEFSEKLGMRKQELLLLQNETKETPVFRAAKYGKLKILKHIHTKYEPLRYEYFPPSEFGGKECPILHCCFLTFSFGVAIWLLTKVGEVTQGSEVTEMGKKLIRQKYKKKNEKENREKSVEENPGKNEEGFTCFQLLSKMPLAFGSKGTLEMGITKRLVYHLLPNEGYESELAMDDAGNNWCKSTGDLESGKSDDKTENPPRSKFLRINYALRKLSMFAMFSRLNYALWKLLAKEFYCIYKIWNKKKKHKFAKRLAMLLVKDSWQDLPHNHSPQALHLIPDFPPNVTEKKKEIELKDRVQKEENFKQSKQEKDQENEAIKNETSWQTPLFLAAASGIIEVVKIIVNEYPEAISLVNEDGLNILHFAIKHRQLEIYEFIEDSPAFESLKPRISKNRHTILHQAATMEYYREQVLPGVAYQLQDELEWYDRVRSHLPDHFKMHCDKGGLTAGDLLDIEHAEMHDQAKQWMKETAQSCSTVAVLIAGVVFAAAYAIPGGTEGGKAVLNNNSAFRFFTIMDVVALACSLGSVVMFLSILTSSFDLWDFHKSLPRKLKLGFLMLFFSLITTMLAFAATILLTIRMEGNKKKTTFIYSLAFVVVSIFGLTQFPLYKMVEDQVNKCSKFWKKVKVRGRRRRWQI